MTINFNVTGAERKELVKLIANFTGCKSKYKGAPTFAYEVDYFTIDRNGALSFDERADSEEIENLIEMLAENGFTAVSRETIILRVSDIPQISCNMYKYSPDKLCSNRIDITSV